MKCQTLKTLKENVDRTDCFGNQYYYRITGTQREITCAECP